MSSPKPLTYDVGLDADGDLPVRTSYVSGFDLILQRVARKLRTVRGEWIGDRRIGLPYFDWLAQKPPQTAAIGAVIRAAIETVPGIVRVEDWTSSFETGSRILSFTGRVQTRDGDATLTVLPFGEPRTGNRAPAWNLLLLRVRRIVA